MFLSTSCEHHSLFKDINSLISSGLFTLQGTGPVQGTGLSFPFGPYTGHVPVLCECVIDILVSAIAL